ncbi:MAG: EAL domain-containing protein [Clostridiales bacterium]|nr:EAL domain-containing protein [Clostridiales bacterium]
MNRKRIALLCGQPEEYCQDLFIKGFNSVVMNEGYDVCVFAMYQKYQDSLQRETGDTSIFDVINYNKFDAVVVMADTIQTPGMIERIETSLKKEYRGKVLFVEGETTDYPEELQDNYYPIKKLISHLIEVHGYKDIAFLTGKSWHPHSKKRMQAYIDAMKDHGLEVSPDRLFYGDFWYSSGESVADRITKKNVKLPEAVACANDAMALGLAKGLTAKGYKVPGDIAVIGYDSNEEGKHAPVPLTSAEIPLFSFGEHSGKDIINMMNGGEPSEFVSDADLFIGCTCGCKGDSIVPRYEIREEWDTQLSESGIYSVFNHMSEDVVNQLNFTGLINMIYSYVYQIRPFDTFSLCINTDWEHKTDCLTDEMLQVIKCGNGGVRDSVNFDVTFSREVMLPELYDNCDHPRVFYFMPFAFDDKIYGYTAIGYDDPSKCIDQMFRTWARRCIAGFEVLRRSNDKSSGDDMLREGLVKDNLTGLYNYQGLLSEGSYLISKMRHKGVYISALAVDVKDLAVINEQFGRNYGDKTIKMTAGMLESVFRDSDSICSCLGNGEFVALRLSTSQGDAEMLMCYDKLKEKLSGYNSSEDVSAKIFLYYGIETGAPETMSELERLINTAVSKKNSNKISVAKAENEGMTEEEKERSLIVNEILDSNRLNYHFQPIVKASDGEIFAYEALMRVDINPYIDPPTVIRYAALSDRLTDVEYETFANVISVVENRKDIFDGSRKVFINSIPGQTITGERLEDLSRRIKALDGTVVIELTEQSELTDDELARINKLYTEMGVDTALDDYGTGYSNVTNLLRYMPRYVKIDRMLLSDIQSSPQKQHFVKDIITFSHDNGIVTLAEGVETSEELKTVIMLGVDLIQGFYTGRPSAMIIQGINPAVKREIIDERLRYDSAGTDTVFVAGREGKIMLPKLNDLNTEVISVSKPDATFIDFTVIGSPELMTNIVMNVTNGYKGRITLDNVGLAGNVQSPALSVDGNSDVTLVIKGDNKFMRGIYVAEGSSLHIEGDGDLSIVSGSMDFYCIGASPEQSHGNIVVEGFDGTLKLSGSGVTGVGIGSGMGGNISLNNARIVVETQGRSTVGIGNIRGNSDIKMSFCDISVVCRSLTCTGIGSQTGEASVSVSDSNIVANIDGRDSMLIGNFDMTRVPVIKDSRISSSLHTVFTDKTGGGVLYPGLLDGSFTFDAEGHPDQS